VLANVTNDMACQNEEIFGPILPIRAFDDENEAFELANKSEHGLSAYVYTGSLSTALKAQEDIMCGNVCINGAHYSIELPHGGKYYILDHLKKRPIFARIKNLN
jgi:acyl-CoA reductase-like NAD-dependent aldehyde dehydrogenase